MRLIIKGIYPAFVAFALLASCQKQAEPVVLDTAGERYIRFSAEAPDVDLQTKVDITQTSTLNSSGFRVTATTGSAGSESNAWNSVLFTKGSTYFEGGKPWPSSDLGYHFYASSNAITFNAAGCRVTATNTADVVCAYLPSPTYSETNALTFKHIFARIGNFTITAEEGHTITNVHATIVPKTGGTYNIRTGDGQTDGTGWSGLTTGSATELANTTPGTKANDLYLVPGTYDITFSWTATKGDYSDNLSHTVTGVSVVGGKVNSFSAGLTGGARPIQFTATVTDWGASTLAMGQVDTGIPADFGGLMIAPSNLFYDGSSFYMPYDDWNHSSYSSSLYGKVSGSSFFNWVEVGSYFDSSGSSFTSSKTSINNANRISYGGYSDWRVPTKAECDIIMTTSPGVRTGSTVNGNANMHWVRVNAGGISGLLIFPDGKTITGASVSNMDSSGSSPSSITASDLDDYLSQGCAFLEAKYYYNGSSWVSYGEYWSATQSNASNSYVINVQSYGVDVSSQAKTTNYCYVRLVRNAF